MKLLVDENLPPSLAAKVADLFPGSVHVRSVDLGATCDDAIWDYAGAHSFTLITRDKDFAALSLVRGKPPKVVLLQVGNCSTTMIERMVRANAIRISDFDQDLKRGLLILK